MAEEPTSTDAAPACEASPSTIVEDARDDTQENEVAAIVASAATVVPEVPPPPSIDVVAATDDSKQKADKEPSFSMHDNEHVPSLSVDTTGDRDAKGDEPSVPNVVAVDAPGMEPIPTMLSGEARSVADPAAPEENAPVVPESLFGKMCGGCFGSSLSNAVVDDETIMTKHTMTLSEDKANSTAGDKSGQPLDECKALVLEEVVTIELVTSE